jgi:nitrite reductase/ring-hydroxylating ferredoxin subunit
MWENSYTKGVRHRVSADVQCGPRSLRVAGSCPTAGSYLRQCAVQYGADEMGYAEMSGMTGDAGDVENRRWRPNRRVVLLGAGACGMVGLSTACGSAPSPAASGVGTGSTEGATTTPGTVASSGAVLAATKDVPVGGGVIVAGVLIVQPASGTFKAFDAACPHRGVQVGPPTGGISTCPAHHSTFAIADGSRLSGPATQGLTEIAISVHDKNIVRT